MHKSRTILLNIQYHTLQCVSNIEIPFQVGDTYVRLGLGTVSISRHQLESRHVTFKDLKVTPTTLPLIVVFSLIVN